MKGMIGLVAGEGTLDWNNQPDFADAIFDDLDDDEALYGIQLGLSYDIADTGQPASPTSTLTRSLIPTWKPPTRASWSSNTAEHHYLLFGIRFHL